ncbi:MAG TPA: cytochrome c biogenesis protein ResB [Pyrinomonadaceae bacterium]|nr:cytochrome c biogenesis protein ResB [Pyrinomonadaceae bacterium]
MSAAEDTIAGPRKKSIGLESVLDFLSSVRLGVSLLCILVVLSMIGMLIVQQNVNGFDAWFVGLTPAEKTVFGALGFFDIYHSWYFNVLLLFLSLNIILASIDRFPSVWKGYYKEPLIAPTRGWLLSQNDNSTITAENSAVALSIVNEEFAKAGYKPSATESSKSEYAVRADGAKDFETTIETRATVVFGERGRSNRLGAYIVHVALLTLFLGHFVALRTGFDADVRMVPGVKSDQIQLIEFNLDKKEKFNVQLPFSIECTDIQQTLIKADGEIDVSNTLDWRTQMRIEDPEYGAFVADVSLNSPVNYRGYRFFQAQTIPVGSARTIKLELTPSAGGAARYIDIPRNGTVTTEDGFVVSFAEFQPDFTFGQDGKPSTRSGDYNNPVAVLGVTPPNGERQTVFAFANKLADNAPVAAPKLGYRWRLAEFEKSPFAHVLSIKYDPFGASFVAWYIGGFGLMFALGFVFFFSHKRIWARVEQKPDGTAEVVLAGNTNRNPFGFSDIFKSLASSIESKLSRGK